MEFHLLALLCESASPTTFVMILSHETEERRRLLPSHRHKNVHKCLIHSGVQKEYVACRHFSLQTGRRLPWPPNLAPKRLAIRLKTVQRPLELRQETCNREGLERHWRTM